MHRLLSPTVLATTILTSVILVQPAHAQQAPAPAAPAATTAAADDQEIIVTARRRSENILSVPMSITATTGEQLANTGVRQMSDLQLTLPGFVPSNSSGYNQMFIRGIGNAIFVGADPSVATFIDDVPRVFGTLVNNFVDVERVEVIKGAPGALYGRNATGGAVNIITRQPNTNDIEGKFRISYGEKATFQASSWVNFPITNTIAWTFAMDRRSHDGYIKNIANTHNPYTPAMFPGGSDPFFGFFPHMTPEQTAAFYNSGLDPKKSYNEEDFWATSSKLLFRPSDTFKITFAADYSKKDDDNGNGAYNTIAGYPVLVLASLLNDPSLGGAHTSPALLSSFVVPVTEKFTTAQRGRGFATLKDWGVSATAVLSLPGVDLTSITSYRKNKSRFLTELGFTPFAMIQAFVPIDKKTLYQELRAVSNTDGPFHYIVGASYLRAQFDGGLFTNLIPPLVVGAPAGSGGYVVHNWSVYAQADYDITDRLNFMVSGRYIHEKNDATSFGDTFSLVEKKFLPAATLKYELPGGGNIYARYARGFKAGGIVPVVPVSIFPDPFTQGGIFKGETVDTYEAGVKTSFLNHKVQFTGAIFYNDYRDVQVGAHARAAYQALVAIAVVNAGSARTYGAEATVTARVAKPLTLTASVGYLNAKYKDFRVLNNPILEDFDLSGTRMINSPKWQLSFNANLDQPVGPNLKVLGNVLAAYTSSTIWQQSGLPGFLPNAVGDNYWLVNARLGVGSIDEHWELALYAKNLFNKGYTTFGGSTATYGNILIWGDPRIVGVEANFKF
jgi:iron complex outermembrane receptor protein